MWGLLWATATSTLNSAVCWALDVGPWKYMLFGNVRGTSKNITTFQVIFFGCPLRSRDTAGNTVEENSSFFTLIWMHCLQGHMDSKTLHQQNPSVLNWRCRLTPAYTHTHTYIHCLTTTRVSRYQSQSTESRMPLCRLTCTMGGLGWVLLVAHLFEALTWQQSRQSMLGC